MDYAEIRIRQFPYAASVGGKIESHPCYSIKFFSDEKLDNEDDIICLLITRVMETRSEHGKMALAEKIIDVLKY